jgi:hypothetical protein
MSSHRPDGSPLVPTASPAGFDDLAREAWALELPYPFERRSVMRSEAALLLDGLLARVARARGALDVAVGEGLAALAEGDRVLRLGYSGIGDYGRERLGVAGRTAQAMARLGRELARRPLLREVVRRGEVTPRQAQAVLPAAVGAEEARWVERARRETVRALERAVREERSALAVPDPGNAPDDEEEAWDPLLVPMSAASREKVEEALELAGRLLGAAAPRWQRLEAICQEYVGAHPDPVEEAGGAGSDSALPGASVGFGDEAPSRSDGRELEALKAFLEEETERWALLGAVAPAPAPEVADARGDPWRLDGELRRLSAMRDRWDELVGHLALLVRTLGLWRDMQYASFGHYCAERLGMGARTVEQRAWLERRLHELPALRQAMRDGRLSYEKARVVAGCADEGTVGGWIERAEAVTCIALRREVEASAEAQACARGSLALRLPRRVHLLLMAAFRAARRGEERWLPPEECLVRLAEHFADAWRAVLGGRATPQRRAVERDGGFCRVPGCSRAAAHAHHVRFRSHGGSDDADNLVAICAAHHLHGVHRGWVRVRGRAPDELVWEVGARRGVA